MDTADWIFSSFAIGFVFLVIGVLVGKRQAKRHKVGGGSPVEPDRRGPGETVNPRGDWPREQ